VSVSPAFFIFVASAQPLAIASTSAATSLSFDAGLNVLWHGAKVGSDFVSALVEAGRSALLTVGGGAAGGGGCPPQDKASVEKRMASESGVFIAASG
jgi:hypothetical protein